MLLAGWCGRAEGERPLWAAREQGAACPSSVRVAPVKRAVQCVCRNPRGQGENRFGFKKDAS